MNKIKIIELLNMISRGKEVPKKIKYDTLWYEFRNYDYKEIHKGIVDEQTSFVEKIDFYKLNDEVEIIEEDKKIEPLKLNNSDVWTGKTNEDLIADKINEIIKKLNKEE